MVLLARCGTEQKSDTIEIKAKHVKNDKNVKVINVLIKHYIMMSY